MPKIKFHTIAAIIVLGASAAWIATGEFASVGSAAEETDASTPAKAEGASPKPAESANSDAGATVRTVAVINPDFTEHQRVIQISGITEADKRTTLATRGAGVIGRLDVEQGSWVKKGDTILTLDGAEKVAALTTAKAVLDQRQNELDNAEELVKRGISPKNLTDNARSALAQAQSTLELAQADLDRLQVVAPFDGIIDSVFVETASWATAGQDVAVLLSLDPVIAKGEISERELSHIHVGGDADVRLINGMMLSGTIRHVSMEATSQTRTFPVEVAIPNPGNRIPAGMTAEIRLKAEAVDAVILPRSVVTLDAEGNLGVRVISAENKVGFVPIDLIDDTPAGLVLGGIPKDSKIIVAGQALVNEGDTVNPIEVGPDDMAGIKMGALK